MTWKKIFKKHIFNSISAVLPNILFITSERLTRLLMTRDTVFLLDSGLFGLCPHRRYGGGHFAGNYSKNYPGTEGHFYAQYRLRAD